MWANTFTFDIYSLKGPFSNVKYNQSVKSGRSYMFTHCSILLPPSEQHQQLSAAVSLAPGSVEGTFVDHGGGVLVVQLSEDGLDAAVDVRLQGHWSAAL